VTGIHIVIEGPTAVGKTTCAAEVAAALRGRGLKVVALFELNDSPLGRIADVSEADLSPRALALAAAAVRYDQIEYSIAPALVDDVIVVSDRWVHSSLSRGRLDGLPFSEVWSYNRLTLVPTVVFVLVDDPAVIQARLAERGDVEDLGFLEQELALYSDAVEFLHGRGWAQQWINCKDLRPDEVAAAALARIDQLTN
jgi:dTMP kinase